MVRRYGERVIKLDQGRVEADLERYKPQASGERRQIESMRSPAADVGMKERSVQSWLQSEVVIHPQELITGTARPQRILRERLELVVDDVGGKCHQERRRRHGANQPVGRERTHDRSDVGAGALDPLLARDPERQREGFRPVYQYRRQ